MAGERVSRGVKTLKLEAQKGVKLTLKAKVRSAAGQPPTRQDFFVFGLHLASAAPPAGIAIHPTLVYDLRL
jgi:hypothetical protein